MATQEVGQKVADSGVVVGWLGWVISHINQINSVLQAMLLIVSIVATLVALKYHLRQMPK